MPDPKTFEGYLKSEPVPLPGKSDHVRYWFDTVENRQKYIDALNAQEE